MWGLQLMAPVRAPVRVFNKMSREARVTVPKLSPLAYSCEKVFFVFLSWYCILKAGSHITGNSGVN